jgi:hypothetical protein
MKEKLIILICILIFSIFSTINASAISISPSSVEVNFEPYLERNFTITVGNSQGGPINISITKAGDLADYITIYAPDIILFQGGETKQFDVILKLPEKIEKPGDNLNIIWANELGTGAGSGISALFHVGSKVMIRVPYPGKYVVLSLDAKNPRVNQTVQFELAANSFGTENISSAQGTIYLYDAENRTLATLQTESKPIPAKGSEVFHASWFAGVDPGQYRALAVLNYDENTTKIEKIFMIGAPSIKIANITAEPIPKGSIGKILTTLQSQWNLRIDDVYLEMEIRDSGGNLVTNPPIKSATISLNPWSVPVIATYWDTTDMEEGEYTAKATLHYLDKTEEASTKIKVVEAQLISMEMILVIIVIILAVILTVLLYSRRKRKTQKPAEPAKELKAESIKKTKKK